MLHRRLILLLVAVAPFAGAQLVPSPPPEIAAGVVAEDHYPVREVSFPNGVKGLPAVPYWEPVGFRPLTVDLYLPPESVQRPAGGFPAVMYIHGGGWMRGDSHRSGPVVDFPGVLASLAARGYVVASIEYRLSGEAKFPAQAYDIKAGIRWLRIHAREYGIDAGRIATWGASAGGLLSALAAVSCNASGLEPRQPGKSHGPDTRTDPITASDVSDCVQAGVAWYGVFDMATIADQARKDRALSRDVASAPEWQLLGCFGMKKCTPQQITAASPVLYVNGGEPPMLLIVGDEDTTVPYHQTLEMAEKLRNVGEEPEVIVLPGINHSLIGKTQEQTRDANLKGLEATFRFFDETIGNGRRGRR